MTEGRAFSFSFDDITVRFDLLLLISLSQTARVLKHSREAWWTPGLAWHEYCVATLPARRWMRCSGCGSECSRTKLKCCRKPPKPSLGSVTTTRSLVLRKCVETRSLCSSLPPLYPRTVRAVAFAALYSCTANVAVQCGHVSHCSVLLGQARRTRRSLAHMGAALGWTILIRCALIPLIIPLATSSIAPMCGARGHRF